MYNHHFRYEHFILLKKNTAHINSPSPNGKLIAQFVNMQKIFQNMELKMMIIIPLLKSG